MFARHRRAGTIGTGPHQGRQERRSFPKFPDFAGF